MHVVEPTTKRSQFCEYLFHYRAAYCQSLLILLGPALGQSISIIFHSSKAVCWLIYMRRVVPTFPMEPSNTFGRFFA